MDQDLELKASPSSPKQQPLLGIRKFAETAKPKRGATGDALWLRWIPTGVALAAVLWVVSHVKWEFVAGLDFASLWKYRFAVADGVANTLLLTLFSLALGMLAGTALAIGMQVRLRPVRGIIGA